MSRPIEPAHFLKRLSRVRLRHLVLYLSFVLPAQTTLAQPSGAKPEPRAEAQTSLVTQLESGKPIERAIAAGESHSYQITLAAGQYARVAVFQRRINVAVSLFDSEGKKIAEEDWFSIGDSELVSMLAETAITYRLEVRAPDKAGTKGSYEIKVKESRPVTEREKSIVAGDRLLAEGLQFIRHPSRPPGGKR